MSLTDFVLANALSWAIQPKERKSIQSSRRERGREDLSRCAYFLTWKARGHIIRRGSLPQPWRQALIADSPRIRLAVVGRRPFECRVRARFASARQSSEAGSRSMG